MLRLALCTDGVYPYAIGGMQRHSRLLAEHLARSGKVKLTVIHPHNERVFDPALGIDEVRVRDIDKRKFYLRELWRYSGRVADALDALAPDVVISQGFCVWQELERFGPRTIVHPHGLEMFQMLGTKERVLGWPFRRALRCIVRRSRYCISLGGKLTGILAQQVEGSSCGVEVIPNAVEVPQEPNSLTEGGPLRLLFVGRFAFNKGLDVLMQVAERFVVEGRSNDTVFQLAGDGPLMQGLRDKGCPPNVQLLGRVDDAQLDRLYRECHALVLPTRFEGMPTVVLEAMAHARPVFVSDVGATAELVTPHNGYLLPPGDAQALYDAIAAFTDRRADVRSQMGAYGRQRVIERFTWPVVTENFIALAERVSTEAQAE